MGRERVTGEIAEWALPMTQRVERLTEHPGLLGFLYRAAQRRAEELEDPHRAADAAEVVMRSLFADDEDPPRAWWATEAGLLCARAIGYHRPTAPLAVAAAILNVSRQRVAQLVELERLIRVDVPRDGITRDSIRHEVLVHGRRMRR